MIDAYGSIYQFYKKFFISSICPYGFTLNGKNINYYDDIKLFDKWKNKIVEWIRFQIEHIGLNKTCVIIGKGKVLKGETPIGIGIKLTGLFPNIFFPNCETLLLALS